jgi:hypothetical protein
MPAVSGSFSCNVNVQTAIALSDQSDHELGLAEIGGVNTSSDENFNNAKLTYWGITDLVTCLGEFVSMAYATTDIQSTSI